MTALYLGEDSWGQVIKLKHPPVLNIQFCFPFVSNIMVVVDEMPPLHMLMLIIQIV